MFKDNDDNVQTHKETKEVSELPKKIKKPYDAKRNIL